MTAHQLFYLVFLGQVLLISYFLPRQVLARMRHVAATYPPSDYPRLYPVPLASVEAAQRAYRNLNRFALVLGLALVAAGLASAGGDMLGWDTLSVMTLYLMIQFSPLLICLRPGFVYFNPKRPKDTRAIRTADLAPRRLFDAVPPLAVAVAIGLYVGFAFMVAAVDQLDLPWFGGYWNLAGITFINLLCVAGIVYTLRSRKSDPYQAGADRRRQTALVIQVAVFTSIAATFSVAISIILALLEMRDLIPVAKSVYFMLVALVCFRQFRIDEVDFEVYREEEATA